MVDMEKSRRALRIFVLFVLFSVGAIFCVEVAVETGKDHTFKSSASGRPETILWKFQKDKVVEIEYGSVRWYRFESRADLDANTGDFTLKQLSKEDNGHYQSEIQVDGKLQYSDHVIKVMDPVTEPTVTCEKSHEGEGFVLRCSLSSQIPGNFTWSGPNGFNSSGQKITVSQHGPNILYFCTVTNEVSSKSTQFDLQKCVEGGGLSGGIIAVIVIVCLIFVGAVLSIVLYKKFRQNKDHQPVSSK
ncbi:hypothetical protein SRHO_G00109700 [Serrasalmus rhombeus]